eukprot:CAMPEP_0170198940 /NCGR_PEP_ID=MMETSP0040_2-20121228/69065_1 /TAXON_ID=641309 /ORGANISM="Lotharella oceanica, Strain CCMP622" /LENGTH=128 /DNA_ID=CAMNT_0010449011 /DNA_START=108 /DNA_END=494 /DNA_ORIENTATION=+
MAAKQDCVLAKEEVDVEGFQRKPSLHSAQLLAYNGQRTRVQFVIGGVQKGGTTTLLDALRGHPQVVMPNQEVHFFDWNSSQNITEYDLKVCGNAPADVICGDKSPSYMHTKVAIERIAIANPDMKWIL